MLRSALTILLAGAVLALTACTGAPQKSEADTRTRVAQTNTELGMGYLQRGERKLAIDKLQRAIESDPNYAPAQHALALAYQEFGQLELAEAHFRKALKLAPNDGAVNNNFGAFMCGQKQYAQAEEYFKAALRDPTYLTPHAALENLGLCLIRQPDYDKAEQYLRQALKVDANLPGALLGMARITFERNQTLNTRGWLQRYETVGPLPADGLFLAAQVERRLGDAERAQHYASELNERYPDSIEAQQLKQLEAGIKP